MAGQPLTSLRLRWEFRQVGSELEQQMVKADKEATEFSQNETGDVSREAADAITRMYLLYPFLTGLSHVLTEKQPGQDDENRTAPILVLVALDENQNTVLPFGKLDPLVKWRSQENILTHKIAALSGGISYCQDSYYSFSRSSPCSDDAKATREVTSGPTLGISEDALKAGGKVFEVNWHLDPLTFSNTVDQQNTAVRPTVRLPATLKIVILFKIEDLPFASSNLALSDSRLVWRESDPAIDVKPMSSSIQLTANGIPDAVYKYRLKSLFIQDLSYDPDGESGESICLLFEFDLLEEE
jgi:hypothetical protein